jgi:hypothetical protein
MDAYTAVTLTWAELADCLRDWAYHPDHLQRDLEDGSTAGIVLVSAAAILDWFDDDNVIEKMQAIKQQTEQEQINA